jgi:predicted DNA-binding transcriptional regulator YafY
MAYKHDYDKTLYRLTTILSKLNSGEVLSVKELAEEFNVSTRTIQRDFNERLTTYPIYQENKKWKMAEGFRLEKTTDIENSIILDIIEKMAQGVGQKFHTKANKLLSQIKNEQNSPIYTKLDIEDITDHIKEIQLLEEAISKKVVIESKYKREKRKVTIVVQPLKIVNFEGFWYLIAKDTQSDIVKKYYLKNISLIKLRETTFTTDERLDRVLNDSISVWFDTNQEQFEVKLSITAQKAKFFQRKPIAPTQRILAIYQDGSIDIGVKITHPMEVIPLIKYWIPHIEVIEPSFIKEQIMNDLKEYMK